MPVLIPRVVLSKRKPVYPRPGKGRLYARVTGDLRGGDDCHCASNEKNFIRSASSELVLWGGVPVVWNGRFDRLL